MLINGASGGVGTFAVQIARWLGAEVTAVCSTRNVEMVRALGADHVIDYKQEDFTTRSEQYDVILAVNGYHPIRKYGRALRPGGKYLMTGGKPAQMFEALLLGPWLSLFGNKSFRVVSEQPNQADLVTVAELIESGKITVYVEKTYPLSDTREAFRDLGEGHARGKIVITTV